MKTIYILTKLYSDGQSAPISGFESKDSANEECFKLNKILATFDKYRYIIQEVELEEKEYTGYYGFYSVKADELHGHTFYTQGNKKVKVTCVDRNPLAPSYCWEDKICVGKVDKFVESRKYYRWY